MKRFVLVKKFLNCLEEDDIVIVIGSDLCKEVFPFHKDGYFYFMDVGVLPPSFELGLSMTTSNRIFVLIGEGAFIRDLSSIAQAAVSKCSNLFYIVFNNWCYQTAGGQPNIVSSMGNFKGMLFSMGFIAHDFTFNFNNKPGIVSISKFMKNLKGPMVVQINVDVGLNKKLDKIIYTENLRNDIRLFIDNSRR